MTEAFEVQRSELASYNSEFSGGAPMPSPKLMTYQLGSSLHEDSAPSAATQCDVAIWDESLTRCRRHPRFC